MEQSGSNERVWRGECVWEDGPVSGMEADRGKIINYEATSVFSTVCKCQHKCGSMKMKKGRGTKGI